MNTKLPKRCKNAALHGGKRLENCTEQTEKTTDCTTKPQTLPSWKVSQIILISGATCRMIAYNDNKSAAEVMQIIFHELAHIILRHTQQSNLGEMEATLFSGVAMLLMVLEQQFHIGRMIAEKGDKTMLKGIQEGLMQKFNAQEVL